MYKGASSFHLLLWMGAAIVVVALTCHRLWLFGRGRRDRVARYVCLAGILATAFIFLRYPSPVRYYLESFSPRTVLHLVSYSLVLWVVCSVLLIAGEVYQMPRWNVWAIFALSVLAQVGATLAFSQVHFSSHFSLSAAARKGDKGAFWYLVQMILYCSIAAIYMVVLLLRLARQTHQRSRRFGQVLAASGLLILVLAAVEEMSFLFSALPMRIHSPIINSLVAAGIICFSTGVGIFSSRGQQVVRRFADAGRYARLRPLGLAIAQAWPEMCLDSYSWWTLLDVPGSRRRFYRIVLEWMDLRRLLTAYLPDEQIPSSSQLDVCAEAVYLGRGLQRALLQPRSDTGSPTLLSPLPDDPEAAGEFLLCVREELDRVDRGVGSWVKHVI